MTCKGICVRYKAQKPVGTGRYASGQRRCQICEIFIKWEGLWCPCCGYRLRTKPRNLKYKAKLRARVEADSIEAKAIAEEQHEEIIEAVVKPNCQSQNSKNCQSQNSKNCQSQNSKNCQSQNSKNCQSQNSKNCQSRTNRSTRN